MEELQAQSAVDGLLGGDGALSDPIVMDVEDDAVGINDMKMRTTVQDSTVPSPDEQARLIEELEAEEITAGEQMYIISSK